MIFTLSVQNSKQAKNVFKLLFTLLLVRDKNSGDAVQFPENETAR